MKLDTRMGHRIKAPEIPHIPVYFMLHMSLSLSDAIVERRRLLRWTRQKGEKVYIFKATLIADLSHFLDPRDPHLEAGQTSIKIVI